MLQHLLPPALKLPLELPQISILLLLPPKPPPQFHRRKNHTAQLVESDSTQTHWFTSYVTEITAAHESEIRNKCIIALLLYQTLPLKAHHCYVYMYIMFCSIRACLTYNILHLYCFLFDTSSSSLVSGCCCFGWKFYFCLQGTSGAMHM